MKKKIILEIDENGNLCDKNNLWVLTEFQGLNFEYDFYDENETKDITKMLSLGCTADDLIKLKANGII